MNRTSMRAKRSISKASPLSKRPKLEFSSKEREVISDSKKAPSTGNGSIDKIARDEDVGKGNEAASESKKSNGMGVTESDWDDDFSGDMLEKVCLIADLSQAMANNEPVPAEKLEKAKVRLFDGSKRACDADDAAILDPKSELAKLKAELQELKEKFKTKEGEVHILRSQLKQSEDAKQAAALQNIKVIDDIQKKYNEKLGSTEKELDTCKTKLQFKDMEFKTLSERCRQLEYRVSKSSAIVDGQGGTQTAAAAAAAGGGFSQTVQSKASANEADPQATAALGCRKKLSQFTNWEIFSRHDGRHLEECLCPEIFQSNEEPDFVHHCVSRESFQSNSNVQKMERHKWTDAPKQKVFLRDLYDSLSGLFGHETFHRKEIKRKIENIMDSCWSILNHCREALSYLENLHVNRCEHDDLDQFLLENEDEAKPLTLKRLLSGEKVNEEECGIEGRRTLALVCALMTASQAARDYLRTKPETLNTLKSLAETIGNLRRPVRYAGYLGGTALVLQQLLRETSLEEPILRTVNDTVEEMIFARPKLEVLTEIVNVLASGRRHSSFLRGLCRKASLGSCSLYMDSKLRQAMFFTKNACPLKLLCMQIMGSAGLPASERIRFDLTSSIIDWLNGSMNTADHRRIKWLPTNLLLNEEERCFDVTECLLYLLILCLKDYLSAFDLGSKGKEEEKRGTSREKMMSVIGHGAVLIKRILKADQRQLNDNSYSLRFAILLRWLTLLESDSFRRNESGTVEPSMEAIAWLADSLEGDPRNQDCYVKQSTSAIPEADILKALKIDDDSKIY